MKKSKKYAALMAAAMLLSGTQLAGATTTYLTSGYGNNWEIKDTVYENNSNTGDGEVGQFYVYTNGKYAKNEEDKEINSATFENVTFKNNTVIGTGTKADTGSSSAGAAVFVKGANVTFNDVEFTNNTVSSTTGALATGGAVFADGVRNNHNYDATVTFNVSKDMTYSGNTVTGYTGSAADTWGSVAVTSGGFLYLDRGATANFNIADGATLTIGNKGETDPYTDSIASSIKMKGQTYSENAINKTGTGTLTVNGEMKDYHGDLNVKEGTMNINSSLASDSVVSVSSGATLNLKKLALNTSKETTQTVVKPDGTGETETITTPEKSGALVVDAGATVSAEEITASDKTSVTVGEGASLSSDTISTSGSATMEVASGATVAADTITASGNAAITVDSGATVIAENGITASDNVTVSLASGSNVSGNLYLTSETAKSKAKVLGSYSGTMYGSDGNALAADTIKSIVGFESTDDKAASEKFQINSKDKNHSVQLSMGDDGTFAIKSYDFSKTSNGQVQTAELGTWDINGNYSANTHNISDVGTLSAKTIKLGGVDLQKTLDSKANVDASNIGTNFDVSSIEGDEEQKAAKKANLDAWGEALGTDTVANNSKQLVTSGGMYTELRPTTDGTYVKKADTTATNLSALDSAIHDLKDLSATAKGVIQNARKIAVTTAIENSENLKVATADETGDTGNVITTFTLNDGGKVASDTTGTGLVTGKTMYTELRPVAEPEGTLHYVSTTATTAANLKALGDQVYINTTGISTNAENITKLTNLSNLETAGKKELKRLAQEGHKVVAASGSTNLTVETPSADENGNVTTTITLNDKGTVTSGNMALVTGGVVYDAVALKANVDASNIGTYLAVSGTTDQQDAAKKKNLDAWGKALGTGTVEADSEQLISGKKLYTELRPTGTANEYALASRTTGESLDALDSQMRKNVSAISTNATNIGTNATNISTNAENLKKMSTLDDDGKKVIRGLASEAVTVKGDGNVSVSGGTVDTETGKKTYTISVTTGDVGSDALVTGTTVASAISSAIVKSEGKTTEALATKANADASNIGNNIKQADGEKDEAAEEKRKLSREQWGYALGTTVVDSNSNQLITSAGLYGEVRLTGSGYHFVSTSNSAADNLAALDGQVFTNQSDISDLKNLSNISTAAKKVIQAANQLVEGNYISVNSSDPDAVTGNITTTISVKVDGEVSTGNTGLVTGGAVAEAISNSEKGTDGKLAGKANLDASNIGDKLKAADGTSDASAADKTKNLNQWGAALGTGKVASGKATGDDGNVYAVEDGSGQLVTGKTMYDELRPTDGEYVKKNQTTAENLNALDAQVKTNTGDIANLKDMKGLTPTGVKNLKTYAQDAVQVVGDETTGVKVEKGEVDANGNVTYTVSIDTTTLTGKLGDGEVTADSNKLVTGATVHNAIQEKLGEGQDGSYIGKNATVNDNLKALDDAIGGNDDYGGDLHIITAKNEDGTNTSVKANLGKLDAAIGRDEDYYGGRDTLYNISTTTKNPLTRSNDGEPTTLKANIGALDAAMGEVAKVGDATNGIKGLDGKVIGSEGSTYKANLTDAVLAVDQKVGNLDSAKEYNVLKNDGKTSMAGNLEALDAALGDVKSLYDADNGIKDKNGAVITEETFNKTGITGVMKTMDDKIGTTSDGNFVSSKSSVGENLDALDQGLTELDMGLRELDRGLSELGDRVNKVGAGAAALAALHAEAFNPDDKLSFAVGFGHYKNANASAIGAFYKPNEDTTFSIGSTIGNGSTMVNAGISFKLGTSSRVEKTMVAKGDYEALQQKVAAQDEKMAAQDAEIEELKKQVALLVAKG